jgi:hypothetical protein
MLKKLVLLLSLLLIGCVTTSVKPTETPDLAKNGVLLLPITDRALFVATGAQLLLLDQEGKRKVLTANDFETSIPQAEGKGNKYYSVFILQPGSYKLQGWALVKTQGGYKEPPSTPMEFSIKAGEVLYIGNFNVLRPIDTAQFRQAADVDIPKFKNLFPWLINQTIVTRPISGDWWPPRKI